jgi:hypothetical protein
MAKCMNKQLITELIVTLRIAKGNTSDIIDAYVMGWLHSQNLIQGENVALYQQLSCDVMDGIKKIDLQTFERVMHDMDKCNRSDNFGWKGRNPENN